MIKTSVASAAGSGAIVLGILEAKVSEIDTKVQLENKAVIAYVDNRHDRAMDRINTLISNQAKIQATVDKIDDRLYNINQTLKGR